MKKAINIILGLAKDWNFWKLLFACVAIVGVIIFLCSCIGYVANKPSVTAWLEQPINTLSIKEFILILLCIGLEVRK